MGDIIKSIAIGEQMQTQQNYKFGFVINTYNLKVSNSIIYIPNKMCILSFLIYIKFEFLK